MDPIDPITYKKYGWMDGWQFHCTYIFGGVNSRVEHFGKGSYLNDKLIIIIENRSGCSTALTYLSVSTVPALIIHPSIHPPNKSPATATVSTIQPLCISSL